MCVRVHFMRLVIRAKGKCYLKIIRCDVILISRPKEEQQQQKNKINNREAEAQA